MPPRAERRGDSPDEPGLVRLMLLSLVLAAEVAVVELLRRESTQRRRRPRPMPAVTTSASRPIPIPSTPAPRLAAAPLVGRTVRATIHDAGAPAPTDPSGSDQPQVGAGQPEVGADQPQVGADQPEVGADQPQVGADQPEAAADQPEVGATIDIAGPEVTFEVARAPHADASPEGSRQPRLDSFMDPDPTVTVPPPRASGPPSARRWVVPMLAVAVVILVVAVAVIVVRG